MFCCSFSESAIISCTGGFLGIVAGFLVVILYPLLTHDGVITPASVTISFTVSALRAFLDIPRIRPQGLTDRGASVRVRNHRDTNLVFRQKGSLPLVPNMRNHIKKR